MKIQNVIGSTVLLSAFTSTMATATIPNFILIDNFNDGFADLEAPIGLGVTTTVSDYDAGLAGTIGGDRLTELTVSPRCNFVPDFCGDTEVNVGSSGLLDVAFSARVAGNKGAVTLGYTGFSIADIREYDLVLEGFNFDQTAVDNTEITVELVANGSPVAVVGMFQSNFDASGTGELIFEDLASLPPVEGTNVTEIYVTGSTDAASDYLVDNAFLRRRPVPESSTVLGVFGVLGVATFLRKRS